MDDDTRHRIESNVALVEHIVTRMKVGLPPHVERDDLVQAGMLALVETAGRYDPDRGVAFSTFVGRRIEGAILDLVRRDDWLPRSVRARSRELASVERTLVSRGSTAPRDREIAAAAGMTDKELSTLRRRVREGAVMALDRPIAGQQGGATLADRVRHEDAGFDRLEEVELRAYVRSALHLLPERHRIVVIGIFLEGRSMDELGALLGVTQSRISQIKHDALRRMRDGVGAQYEEDSAIPEPASPSDRSRADYARAIRADATHGERLAAAGQPAR